MKWDYACLWQTLFYIDCPIYIINCWFKTIYIKHITNVYRVKRRDYKKITYIESLISYWLTRIYLDVEYNINVIKKPNVYSQGPLQYIPDIRFTNIVIIGIAWPGDSITSYDNDLVCNIHDNNIRHIMKQSNTND